MLNSTMYRVTARAVRTVSVRRGPCFSFGSTPFGSAPASEDSGSTPPSGDDEKKPTTVKPKPNYVKVPDIANALAADHDLSVKKSTDIVKQVFDEIGAALADKKSVQIAGFGNFQSYESKARKGRNPSTGESLDIPAKQRVKFVALKHLKDWVQTGTEKTTTKKSSAEKKADDDDDGEEDIV